MPEATPEEFAAAAASHCRAQAQALNERVEKLLDKAAKARDEAQSADSAAAAVSDEVRALLASADEWDTQTAPASGPAPEHTDGSAGAGVGALNAFVVTEEN